MSQRTREEIRAAHVSAWIDDVIAEAVNRRFPLVILRHWTVAQDLRIFEAVAPRAQLVNRLQCIHPDCAGDILSELLRRVNEHPSAERTHFPIEIGKEKYSVTVSRDNESVLLSINTAAGKPIYP